MFDAIAYAAAESLVRVLPEPWSDCAARGVARALHAAGVPARRTLEQNLVRLNPADVAPLGERSLRTFEQFALVVTDFLRLGRMTPAGLLERVEVRGAEHLEAARRDGQGCVILSVHAGCWEWGAAYLAAQGTTLHLLAQPHSDHAVERLFHQHRATWGVQVLEQSPRWVEVAGALRRGEWVAVMGDRAVPELRGSLCGFAGALARRTGARLLPVAMTRRPDGRHVMWCDAPIAEPATSQTRVRDALRRHLERASGQWFAFAPLPEGLA